MSTRSNIYLKLKDNTKGKTIKFDISKLPNGMRIEQPYPSPDLKIPTAAQYIGVYHHSDGYIGGVGKELLKNYKDYDAILNLLSMGDLSSMLDGVVSYRAWRNENAQPMLINKSSRVNKYDAEKCKWKKEKMIDESGNLIAEKALREEYAYLFDGEKWWVSYFKYDKENNTRDRTDWLDLEDEYAKLNNK